MHELDLDQNCVGMTLVDEAIVMNENIGPDGID